MTERRSFFGTTVECVRGDIACQALGPARFIDLYDLKARYGIQRADEMFRNIVLNCLTIAARKSG